MEKTIINGIEISAYPLLASNEEILSLAKKIGKVSDKIAEIVIDIQSSCIHVHKKDPKKGTETCTDCGHTQPITVDKKIQLHRN